MDTPWLTVVGGQRTCYCPEIVAFSGATDTAVYGDLALSSSGRLPLMGLSGNRTLPTRGELTEECHFSSPSPPESWGFQVRLIFKFL